MDYFEYIPSEIYEETLFLLEPDDIFRVCSTNQYALTMCDNKFYQEYIHRNFDPKFYGLEKFTLPVGLNWKQFFNILVYGITLSGDAKYLANNIGKIQVTINFKDTPRDIWNNVITIANKIFEDMYVVNIVIIANTGTKNMRLILFRSHSYLDISSDSIERQSTAKYNRQLVPFNTPISQISEDKNFYFDMVKFWVSLQKKI
jgi:hypothetical protein